MWKIKVLNYRPVWHGAVEKGWAYTPPEYVKFFSETYPTDPIGPDELITDPKPVLWPDTDVVPFHYPHPVTGKWSRGRVRNGETGVSSQRPRAEWKKT